MTLGQLTVLIRATTPAVANRRRFISEKPPALALLAQGYLQRGSHGLLEVTAAGRQRAQQAASERREMERRLVRANVLVSA